jgi:hypothetical protein
MARIGRSVRVAGLSVTTLALATVAAGAPNAMPSRPGPKAPLARVATVPSDFNGDGYSDLAIGVNGEDIGTIKDAGAVNVLYGSSKGVTATGNQFWNQDSEGVLDQAENGDAFGRAVATGDFNGDGFTDLLIGVPHETIGTIVAGAVNVLYGSATGLTADGNQFWNLDSPGIEGDPENGAEFGRFLTTADFNHDGYADVAIAAGGESVGTVLDAGAVHVLYGSATGLTADGSQRWTEDDLSSSDGSELGDEFGDERLTPADFNGDGFADLAVSIRDEGVGTLLEAGATSVLYGSASGLTADGNQFWTQDSDGILDQAEAGDHFARYMGSADFNGDGFDDLAIGVRDEDLGAANGIGDAGAVNVIYGSPTGLDVNAGPGNQFWTQDSPDVLDQAEAGDLFSRTVVGADFNADGFGDVAIGARDETVGSVQETGAVNVLYGSAAGLVADGNQFWNQDSPGIRSRNQFQDRLPISLARADFNADGYQDLAIGNRHKDIGTAVDAGAVHILYGSAAGLTALHNQFISQDSPGILDQAEPDDEFGNSVF